MKICWVRDKSHPHYQEWGKAFFISKSDKLVLVEYISSLNKPSGVCGYFPEVTFDCPAIRLERENA